ncbi:hypothetical protein CA13_73660 [Planctomycetes bacterium CA13]|uniref:Uncharacterized protein n=2 Tax=Novipirellula herctigrandis TaxID=2527986 RepID=A0A5C5YLH0_9BACT|nr:hypothetical protein CA13_73660 [Planctomycetes bacterium CA13]
MSDTIDIQAAEPRTVASRFAGFLGVALAALVLYWLGAWIAFVALTRDRLGQDTANLAGAIFATILIGLCSYFYVSYVCKSVASSRLVVGNHDFTIKAMQKLSCNEHQFPNADVERVIYGQRLSGMEKFLDRLDELGVSRGQHVIKDLKKGRLFVFHKDGSHVDFQFVDKAFDDDQLLAFFSALDANDVPVEAGG